MTDISPTNDAGLYPSILFHFTDRDGLFGILKSNFQAHYSRERIVGKTKVEEFGVPMVSFCDLRLSELKKHMESYGRYGIGMSKEWAKASGLNTVYYINASADLADDFIVGITELNNLMNELSDARQQNKAAKIYMSLLNTYRFIKNYEGELWRGRELSNPNYRFANEREWRFVPHLDATIRPFVHRNDMEDSKIRRALNYSLKDSPLYFEPQDIRYIIVDREDERDDIIRHVLEAKETKYGQQDAVRLASRILTAEQIKSDM